jgi:alpha-glucosidase
LLTFWTELATFQPIDRNHSNKGSGNKEVWVHGVEQENIRRRYIEERYRLLPYLYTVTEELSRTGLPIVRPLFLEFPNATSDSHPLDLDAGSEFLFGPDLLVAPPPFPEQPDDYILTLPTGIWYDYWTGEKIQVAAPSKTPPSGSLLMHPKLETLPVYVREGSIIPMQPLTQSTEEIPKGPMTLRVYPGKNCHGSLYQDDGKTFAYTRGGFLRVEFSCESTPQGISIHLGEHQGSFHPWWTQIHFEIYGWDSPTSTVSVKGVSGSPIASVNVSKHTITFDLDDQVHGADLEIRSSN